MARADRGRDIGADRAPPGQEIPPPHKVPGGPDNPLELGQTGWRHTLKRSGKEFVSDRCTMTSAALAYHWFLALFPALIALLGLVTVVHIGASTVQTWVSGLNKALPPGASSVFVQAVDSATHWSHGASLTALIIGVVVAVWSASGGMAALETGLDVLLGAAVDAEAEREAAARAGHPQARASAQRAERGR
ncbi:MAG TPA: YhjD/YihY/BrkB family envelope integrity protein [Streptosporangiaceae bacterium]|jgi:uncharacterized BrkB/YihY/UPF0761 family membrane protein|nr:YhjD/YihY/BrkB family envelope integrity protein [Streptosporangiaceae bacterium]